MHSRGEKFSENSCKGLLMSCLHMWLADQQKDSKESVRAPSGMIMPRVDSL